MELDTRRRLLENSVVIRIAPSHRLRDSINDVLSERPSPAASAIIKVSRSLNEPLITGYRLILTRFSADLLPIY